jgi:hypothetical protein
MEVGKGGLVLRNLNKYCLLVGLEVKNEEIRERRGEGRIVDTQEIVVLGMSKSLVGVGDP